MSWANTVFKFVHQLTYTTVAPSLSNGNQTDARCDANGRLLVSTTDNTRSWSRPPTSSSIKQTSRVVKASAGTLWSFTAHNTNAAKRYFLLFDSATVPSNGALPVMVFACESKLPVSFQPDGGLPMTAGISWAISTTEDTLTLAAADGVVLAQYS